MQHYLLDIFKHVRISQRQQRNFLCPCCGKRRLHPKMKWNTLTRDHWANVYICDRCARRESDSLTLLRLTQWHCVRQALKGKTFYDLLHWVGGLVCELRFAGYDGTFPFQWNKPRDLTLFGKNYFGDILEAPYTMAGNREILIHNMGGCGTGMQFVSMANAHAGHHNHYELFCDMPFTSEEVPFDIDTGLFNQDGLVAACFIPQFYLQEKIGFRYDTYAALLYANYLPAADSMTMYFNVESDDPGAPMAVDYFPTQGEKDIILSIMEEQCEQTHGCSLRELDASVLE